ncbi:MAG: hypothetical protein GOMPHAMPRED_001807 [Gomphillus americanus]|uniref:Uncharacterized protein n=1 Tax=Gomphillus americanus TaxID=1940652 RepID=A0A8H3F506_9LECA|nr:MAG: hypothetical protein GOMPHAMPRED_001807 [Gomphillus americanus]
MKPTKAAKGTKGAVKQKSTAPPLSQKGKKPMAVKPATAKTAIRDAPKKPSRKQSPSTASNDFEQSDGRISDAENDEPDLSGRSRPVPAEVLQNRYCLFCWDQQGVRVHHSIPNAVELRELERNLQSLQRELHKMAPEHISDSEQDSDHLYQPGQSKANGSGSVPQPHSAGDYQGTSERYKVLLWQLERAQELYKKGFGAPFDLWIDHLTLTQILRDGWTYKSIRQKLPEDWIEDPELPESLQDKRPRFPPGTDQLGDIEQEAAGPSDEELLDELDDNDQRAVVDMYRLRNMSPMPSLAMEDDFDEVGENVSREAAVAALNALRKDQIPELVRAWRDNAKPFTHRDSKLQMKDYSKDVHIFKEAGSESAPSLQAYRAITNIAFSMQAAQRLWKKHGITDEGYSKLLKDGFDQLASLRDDLDEAGVTGLPPLLDLPPRRRPRQRKSLEPFVIDHSMDAKEAQAKQTYAYKPDRPLGPMISENAYSFHHGDKDSGGNTGHGKISREALMGFNMELDQLVDAADQAAI